MSRKSMEEYVAVKRRAYKLASRPRRARILEDACDTLGYTRKYVIKLLTGNLRYHAHKGRGRALRTTRSDSNRTGRTTATSAGRRR